MPYDPILVQPMREELSNAGVRELITPEEVKEVLGKTEGTTMIVVNSVCGCAAGQARPGVLKAMSHKSLPDNIVTVFAGQDLEATAEARKHFTGYMPSSPQIALMKDGEIVFMLERMNIENRTADMIAETLTMAFDEFC